MAELKRRQFLKTSAWAGASLVGTSHRWANANDRIRVALIGAGGRGGGLIRDAHDVEGVEIVTVCDVGDFPGICEVHGRRDAAYDFLSLCYGY